jgi:hypothetical protein
VRRVVLHAGGFLLLLGGLAALMGLATSGPHGRGVPILAGAVAASALGLRLLWLATARQSGSDCRKGEEGRGSQGRQRAGTRGASSRAPGPSAASKFPA